MRVTAVVLAAGLSFSSSPLEGPTPAPSGEPAPAPAAVAQTVLPPADPAAGPVPTEAGIDRVLAPLLKDKSLAGFGLSVVDAATRQPVYGRRGTVPYAPASVTKILTGSAVLATLGPDATLKTRVVRLPAGPATTPAATTPAATAPEATAPVTTEAAGPDAVPTEASTADTDAGVPTLAIVGGGDPSLTALPPGNAPAERPWLPDYPRRSSLATLADRTVEQLKSDGIARVRLQYDTSMFAGPTSSARWPSTYTSSGVVGPVMALSADQARIGPLDGGRVNDPAARTSARFARMLEERGVAVAGAARTEVKAPADAPEVARVESAPLSALVEHMLVASDNDYAEALARQVAVARGVEANFENAAAAVRSAVAELGANLDGVVTHDGSGLSRANRIPAQMLAQLVSIDATGPDQRVRPLVAGLAIAGLTGTLATHFFDPRAAPAAGLVRAKSGSLSGVTTLVGLVPAQSGRLLAFAVLSNEVTNSHATRIAIERITAALLTCGCTDPAAGGEPAPAPPS